MLQEADENRKKLAAFPKGSQESAFSLEEGHGFFLFIYYFKIERISRQLGLNDTEKAGGETMFLRRREEKKKKVIIKVLHPSFS